MKTSYTIFFALLALAGCAQKQDQIQGQAQTQDQVQTEDVQIGGPCEGCEAALEFGDRQLAWVDTMEDYGAEGPKIEVSGTIYQRDGKIPAKDIVLYVYHTDQTGVYPKRGDEKDWGRRHGYLRTWLKTNKGSTNSIRYARPPIPELRTLLISAKSGQTDPSIPV